MAEVKEKETKEKGSAFAIIETGGKQYKVTEGSVITIEKLPGEYKTGDKVTFDSVLMTDDGEKASIGEPYIEKAEVTGEFIEEGRNKKIAVMRYKSKSRYFKNKGHKQPHAKVRIVSIK